MSPAEYEWICEKIDDEVRDLMRKHPEKARQAKEKPALIGWFVDRVMRRFRGDGAPELITSIAKELILGTNRKTRRCSQGTARS